MYHKSKFNKLPRPGSLYYMYHRRIKSVVRRSTLSDLSKISNISIGSERPELSALSFTKMDMSPFLHKSQPPSLKSPSKDSSSEESKPESPPDNDEELDFDPEIDGLLERPVSLREKKLSLRYKGPYEIPDKELKIPDMTGIKLKSILKGTTDTSAHLDVGSESPQAPPIEIVPSKAAEPATAATESEKDEDSRKPRKKRILSDPFFPYLRKEESYSDEELEPKAIYASGFERLDRMKEFRRPEQVGIIKILMKQRQDSWEKDQSTIPPPPPSDDLPYPFDEKSRFSGAAAVSGNASVVPEEGLAVPSEESEEQPVVRRRKPTYRECKFIRPGPGYYEINPTIGFEGHDPTRKRAPGFSFGYKRDLPKKQTAPDRMYDMRDFTMRGKVKPKAFEFGKKRPDPVDEKLPGPGHYEDQTLYLAKRVRPVTIWGKPVEKKKAEIPFAIGELSYMGNGRPAALLFGKPKEPRDLHFPSPQTYPTVDADVFMTKSAAYTMGIKREPLKPDFKVPPIGYYNPNYDYFKKKCDIAIPRNEDECVGVPLDKLND